MDSRDFDRWAENYDQSVRLNLNQFPFFGYYELLAAVQELAQPYRGKLCLDIGIGTGALSEPLQKGGAEIYGIDFSQTMIEKAAKRLPGALFELVDPSINYLGKFSTVKFDRVISTYWMHHLNDDQKIEILGRIYRENLFRGGRIAIGDIAFETVREFDQARIEFEKEWDPREFYMCGEKIIRALKQAGLSFRYRQISLCAGLLYSE